MYVSTYVAAYKYARRVHFLKAIDIVNTIFYTLIVFNEL